MATYYSQYQLQPSYSYPIMMTEWNTMASTIQTQSPVYNTSTVVPFIVTPPQVVTQICPYTGTLVAESVLPSIITNPVITEVIPIISNKPFMSYSFDEILPAPLPVVEQSYPADEALMEQVVDVKYEDTKIDPVEFYLTLPKELFPTARMFSLDPNPIIDEFCKLVNINENTSWILDLEFGIPRVPITRAIPVYDVQFNSIHCKNTPGAIHPGFERCSDEFKRELLFYYDCIISAWYKGYIIMNYDKSVKNFQSWLLVPMQIFGMCWP